MVTDRIDNWRDLEEFGVFSLTGESCGLSIRILCDLSPEGVELIEEFLSIEMTERNNSWNHSGNEGWKSIMLPYGILQELAVFCLAKKGYNPIVAVNWRVKGVGSSCYIRGLSGKEEFDEFRKMANNIYGDSWRHYQSSGTAGTRNRHGWTGRVD